MAEKKVLIITEVFFPEIGSGANRINNLMILLKEKGYKVDVLTSTPSYPNKEMYEDESFWDKDKEKALYENSNIFRVKPSKLVRTESFINRLNIYMVFLLKCILKIFQIRNKYDLIIATTPSVFNGILGVIAKYRFKAKYILDIRDLWPECLKNVGVFRKSKTALKAAYILEKHILRFPNALIINSNGFRPYLESIKCKKKIIFVPNSLTESELKDYKNIEEKAEKYDDFTVIYTGMIGLPQNIKSIIKAANQLRAYENIKFKIIGTGIQKKKVQELIKHYGIHNVSLSEPIPKVDIINEVSKCHVAIAHLRGDSAFDIVIPGKVIDYMGIGIPIIAGVEGYTAQVIKESKSGVIVKPDNYKAMAEEIKKMYISNENRVSYEKNGREYCENEFSWKKNINKVEDLIEEVLRGKLNEKESVYASMEPFHQ